MARWKLLIAHYLNVEGTVWEQIEMDQMTGKQVRKRYNVPLHLDIADPTLWNDNILRNPRGEVLGGDIIVAYADKEHNAKDYIFTGKPSPDMLPLDDEAKAISAQYEKVWNAKPNEDVTYDKRVIERIEEEGARMQAQAQTVKVEGLDKILEQMSAVMQQNAALIATLVPAKGHERRV